MLVILNCCVHISVKCTLIQPLFFLIPVLKNCLLNILIPFWKDDKWGKNFLCAVGAFLGSSYSKLAWGKEPQAVNWYKLKVQCHTDLL